MRLVFGMAGIGIAVWAIVIPFTKIRFHLDDPTLGLILLAGGLGGVSVMPLAGLAVGRFGSRACIAASGVVMALLLPALAVVPSATGFTLLLFLYGVNFGLLDIAMNAQGARVEEMSGRLQMSGFHACYSIGTLAVALADSLLIKLGAPLFLVCVADAAAVLLCASQSFRLVPRSGEAPPAASRQFTWPNRHALILGLCCFAAFMTEGAGTDWSTIYMRFYRHLDLQTATLGYAAFAVAMSLARLTGDRLAMRLGQPALMRLGVALAVAGFLMVVCLPSGLAGILGFGLVGFGTGNLAPLIFSAAARVPGMRTHHSMPVVVGIGYAGFLTGPVMNGLVAGRFGLGGAFLVDAVLLALTFFAARRVA